MCTSLEAPDVEGSREAGVYAGTQPGACVDGLGFSNQALQHFGLDLYLWHVGALLCAVGF